MSKIKSDVNESCSSMPDRGFLVMREFLVKGRLVMVSQRSNNRADRRSLWIDVSANKVGSNSADFITQPHALLNGIDKVDSSPKPRYATG